MPIRFYHYTSQEALAGIRYSETLLPSMNGKFGCGVYFSRLGPSDLPLDKLAANCFGAGWEARLSKGYLNCYIEVIVLNHKKVFEKCRAQGRDVFILRGPMVLRGFPWRVGFVAGHQPPPKMRRKALHTFPSYHGDLVAKENNDYSTPPETTDFSSMSLEDLKEDPTIQRHYWDFSADVI